MYQPQKTKEYLENTARDYYKLIDEQEEEKVLDLFANDACYTRCEAVYKGIEEIGDFYRNQRKITGRHTINSLWVEDRHIIVEGHFDGKGADDSPKHIAFADFLDFNDEGKVQNRRTYLMIGSNYVKD